MSYTSMLVKSSGAAKLGRQSSFSPSNFSQEGRDKSSSAVEHSSKYRRNLLIYTKIGAFQLARYARIRDIHYEDWINERALSICFCANPMIVEWNNSVKSPAKAIVIRVNVRFILML